MKWLDSVGKKTARDWPAFSGPSDREPDRVFSVGGLAHRVATMQAASVGGTAHDITAGVVGEKMTSETPDELTTHQAADLLHVSLPHVVMLLDANEIVSWMAAGERRVSREDVLAYKRDIDAKRLPALKN